MKTLYIVAGANGSGKTTFASSFSRINNLEFINIDELAFKNNNGNIKAGKIFFQKLDKKLTENDSFIIETTLSGKYLKKYILKAKEKRFKTILFYIYLENYQTNINRVEHRVLNGGHFVKRDDIIRRYYRSKNLFLNIYKNIVNEWILYYNSQEVFEEIANNNNILDIKKYNEFLKDTNEINR